MPTKGDLKRKEIYDYIIRFHRIHNVAPTVREIADGVGLKSPSSVHTYLADLKKQNLIDFPGHRARSIQLVGPRQMESRLVDVPVVGRIAAGQPLFAQQNIEEFYTLPYSLLRADGVFMLRVQGDSMIEAGILDGDHVLVNPEASVYNGDIVAAMVDEEQATVKRYFSEPEDTIRLQPENQTMQPILLHASRVRIVGKIAGVFRLY